MRYGVHKLGQCRSNRRTCRRAADDRDGAGGFVDDDPIDSRIADRRGDGAGGLRGNFGEGLAVVERAGIKRDGHRRGGGLARGEVVDDALGHGKTGVDVCLVVGGGLGGEDGF